MSNTNAINTNEERQFVDAIIGSVRANARRRSTWNTRAGLRPSPPSTPTPEPR